MNLFGLTSLIIFFSALGFGFVIYESDRRSPTNRAWLILSAAIAFWGLGLYGTTSSNRESFAMLWQYLVDVSGIFIPVAFLYFTLALTKTTRKWLLRLSFAIACLLTIVSFSPYFKTGMVLRYGFYWIQPGQYYILFPLFFSAVVIISLYLLARAYRLSQGLLFKGQIRNTILAGAIGFGGGVTNFFPQVINVYPFGNYFVILYVFLMSYGVLKYQLFSKKIISAQLFAGAMVLVFLFNLLQGGSSLVDWGVRFLLFFLVVFFSILLVQSVFREVSQREKIESLAKNLEETNERQEKLLHFVGHEVKGYLTKGEYAFSELVDGDFGKLSPDVQVLSTTALAELRKGVRAVTDILQAANLKRGTVTYDMKPIDLRELVEEELVKERVQAQEKKLTLDLHSDEAAAPYTVSADRAQFGEHVVRNLIDNSIKYTPSGGIIVALSKKDGKVLFSVKDTGVGITDEDKARLFTEGGHGKDSMKINVHSTGYGLYIAKNIVVAHKGRIWAESEGEGKGSTFFVELPAA